MPELTGFAAIEWKQAIGILGSSTILVTIGWITHKIFSFGKIIQRLDTVEKDIKDVKKDVRASSKDLIKRVDDLMIAVAQNGLTEAHSPRQLTAEGKRILKDSGIDTIVDDKFNFIVRKVRELKPENAYQAKRAIIDVVRHLTDEPAIKDAIEEGAFNSGSLSTGVLYVGAIYIREQVLQELGLSPEEIGKHSSKKS